MPNNPIDDGNSVTRGLKFRSAQAGTISAIHFHRAAANPYGDVAKLYTAGRTLLGSVKLAKEDGAVPGWQIA